MTTAVTGTGAPRRRLSTGLRPTSKVLPSTLGPTTGRSCCSTCSTRAHVARRPRARHVLTRVTISDLVSVLIAEGLVEELGVRPGQRVGKPAILVGMRTSAYQIVSVDLTDDEVLRGAVVTLTGDFVVRQSSPWTAAPAPSSSTSSCASAAGSSRPRPSRSSAWGSGRPASSTPRAVSSRRRTGAGTTSRSQPSSRSGWGSRSTSPTTPTSPRSASSRWGAAGDGLLVLTVGEGVGAGIMVDGARVHGHADAAGELGHVTVVEDGEPCACGRRGCLETVLSVPALRRAVDGLDTEASDAVLASVGRTLGIALAPVVSALNLAEVLVSGPADLLDAPCASRRSRPSAPAPCRSSAAGCRCGWPRSTKTSSSLGPPSSSSGQLGSREPTTLRLTRSARPGRGPRPAPHDLLGPPVQHPRNAVTQQHPCTRSITQDSCHTSGGASPPPPRITERKHPVKRNRLVAASVASTITLALALTACSTGGSGNNGSGDGESASGDVRVWLVGSDTPTRPATTSRRRSRRRTRAAPSRSRSSPGRASSTS